MIAFRLLHYLFPAIKLHTKLPLLPLEYSSPHSQFEAQEDISESIFLAKGHGLARTDQDAERLIRKHRGLPMNDVIRIAKRKRRREGRLHKALRRMLDLW